VEEKERLALSVSILSPAKPLPVGKLEVVRVQGLDRF
jgi:hypothetical protein